MQSFSRTRSRNPSAQAELRSGLLLVCSLAGFACSGGGSSSRAVPPAGPTLQVAALSVESFTGSMGGPFGPATISYSLTNPSSSSIDWITTAAEPWMRVLNGTGTLLPNANVTVTVEVDQAVARGYADGLHSGAVSFLNSTTGKEDGNRAVSLSVAVEASLSSLTGPQRLAAFIVHFADETEQLTPAVLRNVVFNDPSSANAWFREVSYGKMWFVGSLSQEGDVFEVTLPFNAAPCQYEAWGTAARAQAAAAGFVEANYDFNFFVFAGSCLSRGRPEWTTPSAWMDNSGLRAVCHEGGHALGWNHSAFYSCNAPFGGMSVSSPCSFEERGDGYDMMGSANTYHVNQQKRGQLGWLDPWNTESVLADGIYSIAPIELASFQTQCLRIPRIVGPTGIEQFLYLEARQPIGQFENFPLNSEAVSGLSLRLAGRYDMGGRSYLLDGHPATSTFTDAPLQPGETFTDTATGLIVEVLSVGASGATVEVTLGRCLECIPAAPSGGFSPGNVTVSAGGVAELDLTIHNEDVECPIASFSALFTVPPGWQSSEPNGIETTLAPGDESTFMEFDLTVPPGTPPGTYPVRADVTQLTTNLTSSFSATVTVL